MAQIQYNSIDLNETLSIAARQMYAQYPEEEKNDSFGQALNYISSIELGGRILTKFKASRSFRKEKGALDNMLRIIDKGDDKQRFYDAFQCQQKNSIVIDYKKYFSCSAQQINEKIKRCRDISSLEKVCKDAIRDSKQKLAAKVIRNSTMTSSVIIIIQVVKLYLIWKEISVANNYTMIQQNFNKLKQILIRLKRLLNN